MSKKDIIVGKTTVKEELEYWNIILIMRRLNIYYRNKLRYKVKELQGLEACDFSMQVMEKIISEDYSWARSKRASFIDFVYDVASGELSHFIRDNKTRKFISYDLLQDKSYTNIKLKDNYDGF